jgi:hypothetical protein
MRLYAINVAQTNSNEPIGLFLVIKKNPIATANALAECDEQNPYKPPQPSGKWIQD